MRECPQCLARYPVSVGKCPTHGTALVPIAHLPVREASALDRTPVATPTPEQGGPEALDAHLPKPTELSAGAQVGEYRVTAKIGEGGMGEVYAGVHPVIGKRVAIKVLNAALSQDAGMVQRFVQEARAVNQIGHRNIVDIFAFGRLESGRSYFVMEFLGGRSLRERLEATPPVSYVEGYSILIEVCAALAAAHGEQIVHRDLKPDNVFLVESKGGDRTVKLLDFGIAKLLQRDSKTPLQQTNTGVPMGTPLYMSPEQCLGRGVDWRADIYALGVIIFEMFTGRVPFNGPSYIEAVSGHIHSAPPRPSELADLPPDLEALILRCLAKDAASRPQTAAAVRSELERIAQSTGQILPPPVDSGQHLLPPATPLRKRPPASAKAGAHSRPKLAVVFAVSALFAGAIVAGVLAGKPARPAPAAAPAVLATVELQVVSEPPAATVIVDGKRQSLLTPSTYRVPRARSYLVRVERADFKSHEETVELAPGDDQRSVTVKLEPLKLAGADLQIRTNTPTATWTLDGIPVGDQTGTLSLQDVAPGKHKLSVQAKGFDRREESIALRPQQMASFEWTLTPSPTSHAHAPRATRAKTKASAAGSDDSSVTSGWSQ